MAPNFRIGVSAETVRKGRRAPAPTAPGYYWAKWCLAEDGTRDAEELMKGPKDWEIVEVWENCIDETAPEHLMVHVFGVDLCQGLDCFFWGEKVPDRVPAKGERGAALFKAQVKW